MAQAQETEILPLANLNVAGYIRQLQALQSQAQAYAMVGAFVVPGVPDIPAMIRELLRRLYEEIIRRLLAYMNMVIAMLKSKAAQSIIPLINDVIRLVNKIINNINSVMTALFPACKAVFYVIIAVTTVYVTSKVLGMIPSIGAGMGAVTVFDMFKTVLNNIMNMCAGWLPKLWPVGFAIIAVMQMMIKYYNYVRMWYAMIKNFLMSQITMFNGAAADTTMTAEDWEMSDGDSTSNTGDGTGLNQIGEDNPSELVECTLPDGSISNLTPQECIDVGGTFEGQELLNQLINLEQQINDLHKQLEMISGDEIVNCLLPDGSVEELTLNECIAAGGKSITQEELEKLLAERDSIAAELGKKVKIKLIEDVITSLIYPNEDVTFQNATINKGKRYGFYESYRRVKNEKN